MATNKLTDDKIRKLKYDEVKGGSCQMYADGGGLSLKVTKSGGKLWRISYRYQGQQIHLPIGSYPTITLTEARAKLIEAKRQLERGINPAAVKREAKAAQKKAERDSAHTVEVVFTEWVASIRDDKRSNTVRNYETVMKLHVLPVIGQVPVVEVTKKQLADLILGIAKQVPSQAAMIATVLKLLFRYCEDRGLIENSCAETLGRILPKLKPTHYRAATSETDVAEILRRIETYFNRSKTSPQVVLATKLLIFTGMRVSAVCGLRWADVDLDEDGAIRIEARDGNKTHDGYVVYLGARMIDELRQYASVKLSDEYTFPAATNSARPLSTGTLTSCLKNAGAYVGSTIHGFRQTLKTLSAEGGIPSLISERALGHKVGSEIEAVYNRAQYREVLKRFAQWYEDTLIALRDGTERPEWSGEKWL